MKLLGRLYNFTKRSTSYRRNTRILVLLLLVPVVLILLLNSIILYQENLVSMEEKLDIESEQKLQLLNTNLAPMYQLVDLRRTDHIFSTEYLQGPHFSDTYFQITKALKQDAVWISFFDNINYYNRECNKVFSYDCAKSPDEFFGWGKTDYSYPRPSLKVEKSAQQLLEQEGNHIRTLRAHNIRGEDGIVFAVPIEMHNNACPDSYMIFTVSDTTLANLWGIKDGISYTMFYNEIAIYTSKASSGQIMEEESKPSGLLSKVLMRNYQRQVGGLTILWQIYPLYFLKNIFPSILLEAIITFAVLAVSIMLLLHYSRKNYEPVRQILQHLPQHTERTTLVDELHYIDFMLEDLTSSKIYLEQTNKEMRLEKYLYYIFGNLVEPGSELAKQCLETGIRIDMRWYACILLTDTTQNDFLHHKFLEIFSQKDNSSNLYSMNVNDEKKLYLIASDLDKEVLEQGIQKLQEEDEPELYISCLVEGVQNVHIAYSSICGAVSESEGRVRSRNEYPVLELQFLQAAIEETNINKAEFSVRMLKKHLENSSDIICGAILVAAGAIFCGENINPVNEIIYGMTEFDTTVVSGRLDCWLREYSQRMNVTVKSNTRVLVRNMHTILKYIEEHATLPDFTIKAMAVEFGTSVSNLGHQFKNATGQTLSYFIDDWKIKKAEEMLASGESISEISRKLGYFTTPAFTEAFKRMRGMTPSSYRSNYIGRNSEN